MKTKKTPARIKFGSTGHVYQFCNVRAYKTSGVAIEAKTSYRFKDNPTTIILTNDQAVNLLTEIAQALLPRKNNGRVG